MVTGSPEVVQSYSPETLQQIEKLHGRLAKYLSKEGKPDFAAFGTRKGLGDTFFEREQELTERREQNYQAPLIGGIRRFLDNFPIPNFRAIIVEGGEFYAGVTYNALEDVARQPSLKVIDAYFKHGTVVTLRSIRSELAHADPDNIFAERWWRDDKPEQYPLVVSSSTTNEVTLLQNPDKSYRMRTILMPPGPRLAESGIYLIPKPYKTGGTYYMAPFVQEELTKLSRLPRILGQRQKELAA